jgi:hypothetical protein
MRSSVIAIRTIVTSPAIGIAVIVRDAVVRATHEHERVHAITIKACIAAKAITFAILIECAAVSARSRQ